MPIVPPPDPLAVVIVAMGSVVTTFMWWIWRAGAGDEDRDER